MTLPRFVPLLIVALLSCSSCGDGCGREDRAKTDRGRGPTTIAPTTIPPTTTSTAAPVVSHDGKYVLYRPRRWNVGDVATSEATTVTTGTMTQSTPDGRQSQLPTVQTTVHATWIEKAIDVDADGRRTRYLVHLRTWSRTQGDAPDQSVEGAFLTVSGLGTARRWSFVHRETEATDEAKMWLNEHFGSRGLSDEQWLRILLPDTDVAVGDSWHPDPVRLGNEMAGSGLTIDSSSVGATVTLEAIDGGSARCLFTGQLKLLRVPNANLAWSRGGTLIFEGDMSASLEPAPLMLSALRGKVTLEGETTSGDATVQYDLESEERRTTTAGGEFAEQVR